jgi:hypothetical protein
VLCAVSTLLLVQSYTLDVAPYKLSGAIAKLASINLLKFGSFSYWFDKPWFHTEGRLTDVLITPSLGVSNWAVIYKTPTSTPHHQQVFWRRCQGIKKEKLPRQLHANKFSGAVAGEKEDFCKGSLSLPIFYFVIVLLYYIFACILLSNIQKN